MIMIKYRAEFYAGPKIEKIEVVKESEYFVWAPDGEKEKKITSVSRLFDSFEEARKFLADEWESRLTMYKRRTNQVNQELHGILKLKDR
jgi:hypothetical protein